MVAMNEQEGGVHDPVAQAYRAAKEQYKKMADQWNMAQLLVEEERKKAEEERRKANREMAAKRVVGFRPVSSSEPPPTTQAQVAPKTGDHDSEEDIPMLLLRD